MATHRESSPEADGDRPVTEPVPLTSPAEGVPGLITDQAALLRAADAIRGGEGPVAIDTERASGYRYSQRAYLVQVRRAGAGSLLVDPIALAGEVTPLAEALRDTEWVLHAASQDLPCLAELGMRPQRLFDTELAARLAGFERVALGTMVQRLLGYTLEKGHSADDWSRRPLPHDWLVYAALDVELLIQLRDELERELTEQGKLCWAQQEFEAVRGAAPAPRRAEPWRRTSSIRRARNPRQLAAVRALWEARESVAIERDIAPGRILPDRAIVEAAVAAPASEAELVALPVFRGRAQRRMARHWNDALRAAALLPSSELPAMSPPHEGPPPAARWADRDPDAAARLAAARESLGKVAEANRLPVENLLLPDLVRRSCWEPPQDTSPAGVEARLRLGGARPWQIELTADSMSAALRVTA
ncbi:MAG: HRDC domain-containing protein [Sciscionella sp.]